MPQPNSSSPPVNWKIYLSSTLLFTGMIISAVVFGSITVLCVVLPFPIRYQIGRLWAASVLKMAELTCGIHYVVEGLEHITPGQAAVLVSNHQSAWETIAFRSIFPPQTSLLKKSLLWIPFWGWAMATLKPIAIDRESKNAALRKLLEFGTKALKEGLWVVVFPEGTRRPVGDLGKFNGGGALLAEKSGYPVIPVALNAGLCWPRYSFLKYPGIIKVKIGPMIKSEGRKAAEINKEAERWIAKTLQEIAG